MQVGPQNKSVYGHDPSLPALVDVNLSPKSVTVEQRSLVITPVLSFLRLRVSLLPCSLEWRGADHCRFKIFILRTVRPDFPTGVSVTWDNDQHWININSL